MGDTFIDQQANSDFYRARSKEFFSKIFNILDPEKHELLSLKEVRELIKPKGEHYRGLKVVPVSLIVGSEGRYQDFNKTFLPRFDHIKPRWVNIDKAHLKDIVLPPIKLYKIGAVYFVRDGNHRVSVARTQGAEAIDAEVIELDSEIPINPSMTRQELKQAVINYEKEKFYRDTCFSSVIPSEQLQFSATGRYDEIMRHIEGHKYYLNQNHEKEIELMAAAKSWYENVFLPVVRAIREEKLLSRFPGRTEADLYVWIVKHWDELKKKYGNEYPIHRAARDFSDKYGKGPWQQIKGFIKHLLKYLLR